MHLLNRTIDNYGKKDFIEEYLPPVIERLGVEGITWTDELNQAKSKGKLAIETFEKLDIISKPSRIKLSCTVCNYIKPP